MKSAWPHARSNGPRVRPKGGCHKTMCLETQDPNTHRKKQEFARVCERHLLFEPQSEALRLVVLRVPPVASNLFLVTSKARKVAWACVRRIFCADFVFGLSRSRFQSPTTVRMNISHSPLKPNAAQGTTRLSRRGRWVAAQKPPQQHLAGETSLLGDHRSPTAVAWVPNDHMR